MRRKTSAVVWARSEWLRAIAARGILILLLLVPLGPAGPASATTPISGTEEVGRAQQAAPFSGRVEHLSGRPVADASVRVYHIPSDDFLEGEQLATTKTDQQGRYRLTAFAETDLESLRERHPGFVLLVARAPDDGWFQVDLSQSADFFDDRELGTTLLSRQLLLAPTPARLKTKPLGVATVWRHMARGDRTQQTVYVEITDVADDPQRPAYQLGEGDRPLTQGVFTAAVPEGGVTVHYDRVDLFRILVGSSPGPLESRSGQATPVARWHPTRTDLPVYAFTRALETKTFTSYTERQRREAERYRSYRRLLIEEIAGAAPFASIGLSFIQVVADLSEEAPGPSTTVGSGGSPVDLNRQDRVQDGWVGKAHSVVFEVPMTLRAGELPRYPIELRATWSDGQAQLAHQVELDLIEKQPEPEPGAPRQPEPERETVVVNALERGASAEVHQPTWIYNEDRDIGPKGMIDDDPGTQWEVQGNPAKIEAIFHLPRPARVVGDYIHVGGTGGNRDITEYHLMVRRNGRWIRATTIRGSVTGDGSPDAAHTFDEPITGQHFKIVITEHTAPRLCYSQCDVPIAEYQLKGQYIE